MPKKMLVILGLSLFCAALGIAEKPPGNETIPCRAMEVFVAEKVGATAVIFHQRDKADGPRLGDLLLTHSGDVVEFRTAGGRWQPATVARVKSCFGRGLLLFRSSEVKLAAQDEFVIDFSQKN